MSNVKIEQITSVLAGAESLPEDSDLRKRIFGGDIVANASELEFEILSELVKSDVWPSAVSEMLICNVDSTEDKLERAGSIIEIIISKPLEDKKFLDFGCGEGHVVAKSKEHKTKFSIGYDIAEDVSWDDNCTTDWRVIVKHAPYDVILCYDVLDHAEYPIEILFKMKSVLALGGVIFLRAHPWCSKHGTHLYRNLNKAYAHLVFNKEELEKLGVESGFCQEVIHPAITYGDFFKITNFKIYSSFVTREPVDKFFFNNPIVSRRIKEKWNKSYEHELSYGIKLADAQMEQQFHDYVLSNG